MPIREYIRAGDELLPTLYGGEVREAPANGRDSLVLGAYDPGPTTTGVLPGTVLTPRTSGQPTPAGSPYIGIDWQMQVTPPAGTETISFINCRFSGAASGPPGTSGQEGLLKLHGGGHCPVVLIDCTLRPQTNSHRWIGFHGYGFSAFRCDLSYLLDIFSVFNKLATGGPIGVTIEQSWLHDHVWYPQTIDPHPVGDGSHSDPIQIQDGVGGVIRGNNIQGYNAPEFPNTHYGTNHANVGILLKPDVGDISGWVISDNLIAGGGTCTLNFAHRTGTASDRYLSTSTKVATVHRNRFVRDSSRLGIEVLRPGTVVPNIDFGIGTANQNVFSDNGQPISINNGAG